MKNIFTTLVLLLCFFSTQAQIVISEVSYNPPESGADSLEYIELYNSTENAINLEGYSFTQGVELTFGNVNIAPNGYLLTAKSSVSMLSVFGVNSIEWEGGAMSNGGEDIEIVDADGNVVDFIDYKTDGLWPTFEEGTNGAGASIELCDLSADNADGHVWEAAVNNTGVVINGADFLGTPGVANTVECDASEPLPQLVISEILFESSNDNYDFVEIYNNGLEPVDMSTINITTSSFTFNGGPMLMPDAYFTISTDADEFAAAFPDQTAMDWDGAGLDDTGDLISLTSMDGAIIDTVRYSSDWKESIAGTTQSIGVIALGASNDTQDNWCPSDGSYMYDGLELKAGPNTPTICFTPDVGVSNLADVIQTDSDGVLIMNDEYVKIQAIVYGINLRPGGLQFTVINNDNSAGIGVFSAADDFGYEVTEGDWVELTGNLGQFNGLAQIYIDNATLLTNGNPLVDPSITTSLGEDTESRLVRFDNASLVDPSQWTNAGPGFNVDVTNGSETIVVRIDNDMELYSEPAPEGAFHVIGIGGQFDAETPFSEGYQLLPRYGADFIPISSNKDLLDPSEVLLSPNPVQDILRLTTDLQISKNVQILNAQGRVWNLNVSNGDLDVSEFPSGMYYLKIKADNAYVINKFVKL